MRRCAMGAISFLVIGVPAWAGPPTFAASKFTAMLGVDTHLSYTDGTYGQVLNAAGQLMPANAYVNAASSFLGIRNFRDAVSNGTGGSSPISYYQTLAADGIYFSFLDWGNDAADLSAILSEIDQVNGYSGAPGHVQAIEGPNEINNAPVCWTDPTHNCATGMVGALAEQAELLALTRADTAKPHIGTLYYFTGWTPNTGPDPVPGYANYNNQHPYPEYGQPPYFWLGRPATLSNTGKPNEAAVYTETGYAVGPLYSGGCNGGAGGVCWNAGLGQTLPQVDETLQAKLTLDIPFDAMLQRISRVALYQLLEAYPEQGPKDDGFGMFDYSASGALLPRPVAVAMRNLLTIVHDSGTVKQVSPLNYQVSGLPVSGYCPGATCTFTPSLALQKSDGQYIVAVWAEQQVWDDVNDVEVAAPTLTATVTLPRNFSMLAVYDPYLSALPLQTVLNSGSISVSVTDRPILVVLTP